MNLRNIEKLKEQIQNKKDENNKKKKYVNYGIFFKQKSFK